ncbi:MAG: CBS domain-containing protein, partial [Candidatus Xenobia bacterium]
AMIPLTPSCVVGPEVSLTKALEQMGERDLSCLLVMDHGQMVGLLTRESIMRLLEIRRALPEEQPRLPLGPRVTAR